MNKTLSMFKPGLMLLLIAAVAALILGLVNLGTAGRIAAIAEETMNRAMQAVLPAAAYADTGVEDDGEVEAIYAAEGGGWVVQVTESGSQGLVTMMVGVSSDYVCTGVSITESSETAGLGAIAGQPSEKGEAFRAQFVGQSGTVAVTKEGGTIDAISGATITSKAVCRGVTAALAACQALGDNAAAIGGADGSTEIFVTLPNTEPAEPPVNLPSVDPGAAPSMG